MPCIGHPLFPSWRCVRLAPNGGLPKCAGHPIHEACGRVLGGPRLPPSARSLCAEEMSVPSEQAIGAGGDSIVRVVALSAILEPRAIIVQQYCPGWDLLVPPCGLSLSLPYRAICAGGEAPGYDRGANGGSSPNTSTHCCGTEYNSVGCCE